MSYTFVNDTTDVVYRFNVCGSATVDCIPPYPVEFQKGVAIQFFGDDPAPNATCTTKTGDKVPCTKDCEVLAVGVPFITLIDPSEPFLGVNVTHRGVPSLPQDLFRCPEDPTVRLLRGLFACHECVNHHFFACRLAQRKSDK